MRHTCSQPCREATAPSRTRRTCCGHPGRYRAAAGVASVGNGSTAAAPLAFTDPQSPFRRLTQVSTTEVDAFGIQVWRTINEVNLIENIQPTRARATLVLHKGADHSVTRVRLRRF